MRKLLTGEQMKQADTMTIQEYGIPSLVLMERAALAVVQELQSGSFCLDRVLVVCGTGNNGGDGIAIARMLHVQGVPVDVVLIGAEEKCSEETARQIAIFKKYGGTLANSISCHEYTTITDALFGAGLTRNIEGKYAQVIEQINESPARVLAVDLPSGISTDTGRIMGTAVRADVTVTFAYEKLGTVLYPGTVYAGEVRVADIGITDASLGDMEPVITYDAGDKKYLPERAAYGNKGTFGKVLLIAGTTGLSGAACLSAEAAYRSGSGLVRVFTPEENRVVLQTILPEAMVSSYQVDRTEEACQMLRDGLAWADVVVAGPGTGTGLQMEQFLEIIIREWRGPLLIDADGLNILAQHRTWMKEREYPLVLTPHLGEMARLSGESVAVIQQDLIGTAVRFAHEYKIICVMKDARTIVTDGNHIYINTTGNSGMATGGSGDVLSGVIGGLAGSGMQMYEAAKMGVFLHGAAGDEAAAREGGRRMLAGDILKYLMRME